MSEPIQHVVLEPDEAPQVRLTPLEYGDVTAVVGYPLQIIHLLDPKATMYVHEDAKASGAEMNPAATQLAQHQIKPGDYIAGTALVSGPLAAGGRDTSLSDEAVNRLFALSAPGESHAEAL